MYLGCVLPGGYTTQDTIISTKSTCFPQKVILSNKKAMGLYSQISDLERNYQLELLFDTKVVICAFAFETNTFWGVELPIRGAMYRLRVTKTDKWPFFGAFTHPTCTNYYMWSATWHKKSVIALTKH